MTEILKEHIQAEIDYKKNTPVLPEWFDMYVLANKYHPQANYGMSVFIGGAIITSLQEKKVDLPYIVTSNFTQEQLKDIKGPMEDLHRIYNVDRIPDNKDLAWNTASYRTVWTIMEFMDPSNERVLDHLDGIYTIQQSQASPKTVNYLNNFPNLTKKYDEKLDILRGLYKAGTDALETKEARKIAKQRKDTYRIPNTSVYYEEDLRNELITRMTNSITTQAKKYNLPSTTVDSFINILV